MYSRGLSLPSGRSVTLQSRPTTNNYFNYRLFNASFCLWNMKHFCIFTWLIQIVCFIQSTVQHPKIFNVLTYTTKYQILVFQDLEREWVVQFLFVSAIMQSVCVHADETKSDECDISQMIYINNILMMLIISPYRLKRDNRIMRNSL